MARLNDPGFRRSEDSNLSESTVAATQGVPAKPLAPRIAITLTYAPGVENQPGFTFTFSARDIDLTDPHFIHVDHGPDISFRLDCPVENLNLNVLGRDHKVDWIGTAFRFPARDIYGITFLRRGTTEAPE